MKKILIYFALCFIMFPVMAQDTTEGDNQQTEPEAPGFGLQADIFSHVQPHTGTEASRSAYPDYALDVLSLADYKLTPGDIFTLTVNTGVLGEDSQELITTYNVQLQMDYTFTLPYIGKVDVRGMSLPEIQDYVNREIRNLIPVQYVNFSLTTPARFNVFLYGGVGTPGYIVATPLMHVLDAIARANGFRPFASYRSIELRRNGETRILDISRYYKEADFEANPFLQPGDIIFVPPAEIVVHIEGMVRYPGTYELIPGEELDTLFNLAGEFLPGADTSAIEIQRIDESGKQATITRDIKKAREFKPQHGDRIYVRSTTENSEMITIEGAVYGKRISGTEPLQTPVNSYRFELPYYSGISLLAVLDQVGGPTPFAIMEDAEIKRRATGEVLHPEMEKLWESRDYSLDIELKPGDYILIPIINLQVFVSGQVETPGSFPYKSGNTVRDYILAAGGIDDTQGDPNGIFFIQESGYKQNVGFETLVPPDTVILVERNPLYKTDKAVKQFLVTTGWITSIVGVFTSILIALDYFTGIQWDSIYP